jgi:type IV pilus assembly protein PilQ
MRKNNRYRKHRILLTGIIVLSMMIAACSGLEKEPASNKFFEEWKARAEESKGYTPAHKKQAEGVKITDSTAAAGTAAELLATPQKPLPTKKITMKMSDIDVSVLLRALARVANQNIILNQKVSGKVNINITEAPWNQVFEGLLRTHGLTYAWEGDIIRIMTLQDMETELKRESQKRELSKIEPLVTRVVKVTYADAGRMRNNLEKFISPGIEGQSGGTVLVDEHTNSLILQAIPNDINRMLAVVNQLDRPISQVLIEAHIVETTNDTARALGVQWGGVLYGSSNGKNAWLGPAGVTGDGESSLFDPDTGDPIEYQWPIGNVSNFPINLQDSIGLSLGFMFQNIGNSVLTAQLQALQEEGRLNILSSPSITTLENKIAFIESGDRIPIQTVENGEVNIEYVSATLRLEVTPNIVDKETLKLKILTNKDEPDFTQTVAGNPTIITRKAETNVILFNGQTTVIGGLSQDKTFTDNAGIPFLKDVPGLGWLFGSRSKANEMDELLIFITPYILEERTPEQMVGSPVKNQPAK